MVANTLLTDPPTIGIKRWKFNFSEQCHVLSNYGNYKCSNMVANILPVDPLNPGGQKVKIHLLKHGHVAYQIKGNHKCSNMVATIMPTGPSPLPGINWSKSIFLENGHDQLLHRAS